VDLPNGAAECLDHHLPILQPLVLPMGVNVACNNAEDAILVHVERHLDLRCARLARRQAREVKLAKKLILACLRRVAGINEDANLILVIVHCGEDVLAGEGERCSTGNESVHVVTEDLETDAGELWRKLPALERITAFSGALERNVRAHCGRRDWCFAGNHPIVLVHFLHAHSVTLKT
jgi:hypothetical protein